MSYKLLLTSYAASGSSDNLHPTITGGNWIEVGKYEKEEDAKTAAKNLSITQNGSLPGPNTGYMMLSAVVKV